MRKFLAFHREPAARHQSGRSNVASKASPALETTPYRNLERESQASLSALARAGPAPRLRSGASCLAALLNFLTMRSRFNREM